MLRADERYRDTLADVPASESLKDTERRVKACWDDTLAPALRAGKNVLVVSHGNTLRALVKLVDGVSSEDSFHLDLPTACPVVYELNKDLKPAADPIENRGPKARQPAQITQGLRLAMTILDPIPYLRTCTFPHLSRGLA